MADDVAGQVAGSLTKQKPIVIVGVVGAGVGIGLYLRHKRGSKVDAPAVADTTVSPAGRYTPGMFGLPTNATPPTPPEGITTNRQWLNKGIVLLGAASNDPGQAQAALTKFLNGDVLTPAEATMVSTVITTLGPPPEGAPAMRVGTSTTATPPVAPTDLRGLTTLAVLDQGDAAVRAGSGFEPFAQELARRITVDHSLSINEVALRQPSGAPRPIVVVMLPLVLQFMQNAGAHF